MRPRAGHRQAEDYARPSPSSQRVDPAVTGQLLLDRSLRGSRPGPDAVPRSIESAVAACWETMIPPTGAVASQNGYNLAIAYRSPGVPELTDRIDPARVWFALSPGPCWHSAEQPKLFLMDMKALGRSGVVTSEFIFGAGSIGGVGSSKKTLGRGISADQGTARLDEAAQLSIRVVDTADAYGGGQSEQTVGAWLAGRTHDNVLVSTKVGNTDHGVDLSPRHMERQLAQSIRRLGRVDLYSSHAPDPSTPLADTLEAFNAACEAGTIKAFGVCNVGARQLEEILSAASSRGLARPEWVQNGFSLLNRGDEKDLLPLVAREGLAFTPFSPLAGGVLSDRYLDGRAVDPGSRIAAAGDLFYPGIYSPDNLKRVDALRVVARRHDISVSGLALAWLRSHPAVTAPIVSPSRADQWKAVQEALVTELDEDEQNLISELFASTD